MTIAGIAACPARLNITAVLGHAVAPATAMTSGHVASVNPDVSESVSIRRLCCCGSEHVISTSNETGTGSVGDLNPLIARDRQGIHRI